MILAVVVWLLVLTAVAIAISVAIALLLRPAAMMRVVVTRMAPRGNGRDDLMDGLSRLLPYRWLLSGATWREAKAAAVDNPERLPRVIVAYRLLGGSAIAIAVGITIFVIVAAFAR